MDGSLFIHTSAISNHMRLWHQTRSIISDPMSAHCSSNIVWTAIQGSIESLTKNNMSPFFSPWSQFKRWTFEPIRMLDNIPLCKIQHRIFPRISNIWFRTFLHRKEPQLDLGVPWKSWELARSGTSNFFCPEIPNWVMKKGRFRMFHHVSYDHTNSQFSVGLL